MITFDSIDPLSFVKQLAEKIMSCFLLDKDGNLVQEPVEKVYFKLDFKPDARNTDHCRSSRGIELASGDSCLTQ